MTTYSSEELLKILGPPARSGTLPQPGDVEGEVHPWRYMAWDCVDMHQGAIACLAVSALPPTWFVVRVCSEHAGKIEQSLREFPSTNDVLPYEIVVVRSPSYEDQRGADWEALQQRLTERYETLAVGTDARIPGKHVFILRRILSCSLAYTEAELLGLLGPPTETGIDNVPSSGEQISARYMRWDCSRPGVDSGSCMAISIGEEWFLTQLSGRHDRHGNAETYQVLFVDEESFRHERGNDWATLKERLAQGFEVLLQAKQHEIDEFRVYLLGKTSRNGS